MAVDFKNLDNYNDVGLVPFFAKARIADQVKKVILIFIEFINIRFW